MVPSDAARPSSQTDPSWYRRPWKLVPTARSSSRCGSRPAPAGMPARAGSPRRGRERERRRRGCGDVPRPRGSPLPGGGGAGAAGGLPPEATEVAGQRGAGLGAGESGSSFTTRCGGTGARIGEGGVAAIGAAAGAGGEDSARRPRRRLPDPGMGGKEVHLVGGPVEHARYDPQRLAGDTSHRGRGLGVPRSGAGRRARADTADRRDKKDRSNLKHTGPAAACSAPRQRAKLPLSQIDSAESRRPLHLPLAAAAAAGRVGRHGGRVTKRRRRHDPGAT